MTKQIHTVTGPVETGMLGLVLPHEHLFTDLRGPYVPDYAQADPAAVVKVVQPYLEEVSRAGVTALVECSTIGVGHRGAVRPCTGDSHSDRCSNRSRSRSLYS